MKVKIRKAKQADLIDIAELWKEFIDYHRNFDSFFTRSRNSIYYFNKYASNHIASKKSLVLIAKLQNKTVGYSISYVAKHPPVFAGNKYSFISDLMVSKDFRKSGLGKKLFKENITWFKLKNIKRVELSVSVKNPSATKFWKKMGFEPYMEKRVKKL
jgi:ribosomal protein S18 acetylase RimI-like enzyme